MRCSLSSRGFVGVDLVEFEKAKNFYEAHKNKLPDFFSSGEVFFIQSYKKPHERLAMILGAKEALFKASHIKKPGLLGFRDIEIIPGNKKFCYKLTRTSKKRPTLDADLEISFIRKKKFVVVQCYPKKA